MNEKLFDKFTQALDSALFELVGEAHEGDNVKIYSDRELFVNMFLAMHAIAYDNKAFEDISPFRFAGTSWKCLVLNYLKIMTKFKLTSDTKMWLGHKLFRIEALIDFSDVKKGALGGYIEKEENLSHEGNAWVYGNAKVYGNAWVCDNAKVHGNAWVCGNANICGDADYLCFKGLGSCNRNTTFYKTEGNGVSVACGCFSGTIDEFVAKVQDTHKDSKYAKEYLAAVEVVKIHFDKE